MVRALGAGSLRDRIRIERDSGPGEDEYGNPVPGAGWETLIPAQPAQLTPRQGTETVQAQRLTGIITWEIRLRFTEANAAIRASDRAVNERTGAVFNIRHAPIDPDSGKRHWLVFQVQSGVAT